MSSDIDWESGLGLPTDALEDDIKGMDELSLSNKLLKTEDEIQKFTIDESLDDVSKAIHLLKFGIPVQKFSVLNSLEGLMNDRPQDLQSQVLDQLYEVIPNCPIEFQLSAGRVLKDFTDKKLITDVLPLYRLSRKLFDSRYSEVSATWSEVILTTIKVLPVQMILNEILPWAITASGLAQPSAFRIWCCQLLGAISPRLDKKKIEDLYLKKALLLCQDTDYEVRSAMADQLNVIARSLGLEKMKKEILKEYEELIYDEHHIVKERAMINLLYILDFLDVETKVSFVIPTIKKHFEIANPLFPMLLKEYGNFIWNTKDCISESDLKLFMQIYFNMATGNNFENRRKCAYNFPGVLKAVGPDKFEIYRLNTVLQAFSEDDNVEVRKILASSLHEIAKILGKSSLIYIRTIFTKLLSDEELEVLQIAFLNIAANLDQIYSDDSQKKPIDEILLFILRKERELITLFKCNWRVHYHLLENYERFPMYFDSDQLNERVVPILFKILGENVVIPIKHVAIQCLCFYLRNLKRVDQRDNILKNLIVLKDSENYHTRMLFFFMIETIISRFSKKFFRDNLLHEYLELSHDPVPNIRLKFVSILPLVRKTLRMPQDTPLLQKISDVTEPLLTRDLDRDVVQMTGEVFAELGLFGFRAGVEQSSLHNSHNSSSAESITDKYLFSYTPNFDDSHDKEKEEEEKAILLKEWSSEDYRKKLEKGRNSIKMKGDLSKKSDIRKKNMLDGGTSQKTSPNSSTTKIASKTLKGVQSASYSQKSQPSSPILTKNWKASSANYKTGSPSPKQIHEPRHSSDGIEESRSGVKLIGNVKSAKSGITHNDHSKSIGVPRSQITMKEKNQQ